MKISLPLLCMLLLFMTCTTEKKDVHNSSSDAGHILSPSQDVDSVILKRELVISSYENIEIDGHIAIFTVDTKNRLYISPVKPGVATIYVYSPEGNFIQSIGRKGRGPGEFESIRDIIIHKNKLYVYDPVQYRVNIFVTADD